MPQSHRSPSLQQQPAGIDIPKSRLARDQAGNPNLPGGAHLSAREWAAIGECAQRGCAVRDANGTLVKAVMAAGAGTRRLYLLPEQGIVVVRLAEMTQSGQDCAGPEFLRLLLEVR